MSLALEMRGGEGGGGIVDIERPGLKPGYVVAGV